MKQILLVILTLSTLAVFGQYNYGYDPNLITGQSFSAGVGSQGNFYNPRYYNNRGYYPQNYGNGSNLVAGAVGFGLGLLTGVVADEAAHARERKAVSAATQAQVAATPQQTMYVSTNSAPSVVVLPERTSGTQDIRVSSGSSSGVIVVPPQRTGDGNVIYISNGEAQPGVPPQRTGQTVSDVRVSN